LNFEVRPVEVRLQSDIDDIIGALPQQNIDAIAVVGGTLFFAYRRQIVAAITATRLPCVYGSAEYAEVGGLVSYGPNVPDSFRQAAGQVAKILRGAKPAVIPFEQATKFELAINVRTAKNLGIVIPQSILVRADKVFD
jgi:putative ABC transport system substrate-binding protein